MKKLLCLLICILCLPFMVNAMSFEVETYINDELKTSFFRAYEEEDGIYVLYSGYDESNALKFYLKKLDLEYNTVWSKKLTYPLRGLLVDSKDNVIVYGINPSASNLYPYNGLGIIEVYNKNGELLKTINRVGSYPANYVHVPGEESLWNANNILNLYEVSGGYVYIGRAPYMYATTNVALRSVVGKLDATFKETGNYVNYGNVVAYSNGFGLFSNASDIQITKPGLSRYGSSTKGGQYPDWKLTLPLFASSDMVVDSNNNFYIVGAENSIATIIKYDYSGQLMWKKQLPGTGESHYTDIEMTNEGRIVVVGKSKSTDGGFENNGDFDAIVVVYDENGNVETLKNYGGKYSEGFEKINIVDNYHFIMGGTTSSECFEKSCNLEKDKRFFLVRGTLGYDIFVEENENGRTSTSQDDKKGYVVVNPNKGYLIDTVIAKDVKGNSIQVTKEEGNKYSFDLNCDVYVTVTYKKDFKVTVNYNDGGKVTTEKIDEESGRVILLPQDGFKIESVIIKNSKGEILDYEVKSNGYYYDIKDDLVITIVFKEIPKEEQEEIENPKTADMFIYYSSAIVCTLFGIWSVEQYRKTRRVS